MRSIVTTFTILAMSCSGLAVAEELQSGLKVGENAGFFLVKDITGPSAGKSLCYR